MGCWSNCCIASDICGFCYWFFLKKNFFVLFLCLQIKTDKLLKMKSLMDFDEIICNLHW